jgi:hypothetical protein
MAAIAMMEDMMAVALVMMTDTRVPALPAVTMIVIAMMEEPAQMQIRHRRITGLIQQR